MDALRSCVITYYGIIVISSPGPRRCLTSVLLTEIPPTPGLLMDIDIPSIKTGQQIYIIITARTDLSGLVLSMQPSCFDLLVNR